MLQFTTNSLYFRRFSGFAIIAVTFKDNFNQINFIIEIANYIICHPWSLILLHKYQTMKINNSIYFTKIILLDKLID